MATSLRLASDTLTSFWLPRALERTLIIGGGTSARVLVTCVFVADPICHATQLLVREKQGRYISNFQQTNECACGTKTTQQALDIHSDRSSAKRALGRQPRIRPIHQPVHRHAHAASITPHNRFTFYLVLQYTRSSTK
jgi:hypothetical protein